MKLLSACTLPVIAAATALLAVPTLAQEQPSTSVSAEKSAAQKIPASAEKSAKRQPQKQTHIVLPNGITLLTVERDPSDPVIIAQREKEKEAAATLSLGEESLRLGQNSKAIQAFQKVMQIEPEDFLALQLLAEAYTANQQFEPAIAAYRALIYPKPGQDWTTSNQISATVLMNYCLVLLQTGQEQEALAMYNRGVPLLNYDHGKQRVAVSVLLPKIGQDGLPYNSQLLQAMAFLAVGLDEPGLDMTKFKEAARLAPDSAVTNFYLGKYLYASSQAGAKAALEKAALLGDDQTRKAANDYLQLCR